MNDNGLKSYTKDGARVLLKRLLRFAKAIKKQELIGWDMVWIATYYEYGTPNHRRIRRISRRCSRLRSRYINSCYHLSHSSLVPLMNQMRIDTSKYHEILRENMQDKTVF